MGEALLRDVVRDVVAARAPEETVLLDGLTDLPDGEVTRLLRGRARQRNGPLGFGLPEAVALVTPVVWLVLDEIAQKAGEAAAEGTVSRLRRLIRRLLRRRPVRQSVPRLTPEQLDVVHGQVVARGVAAHLDEETALGLADAVVSRLARSTDEAPH
jgi:hypothetical protein